MVEYCTHPTIGTVHLCDSAPVVRPRTRLRTLCGVLLTPDWPHGDETLSGLAATCQRCSYLFRPLEERR